MNPWLQIPSSDYEAHMSSPDVQQLPVLNEIFRRVVDHFNPRSVCIPGSTTGNGFEHLIGRELDLILGIDINYRFLSECRAWFAEDLPNLNLLCADLNSLVFRKGSFDLVHAALVFEYVDVDKLVADIYGWLNWGGIMSVVLQLPSEHSAPVSDTPYESLKQLNNLLKLVEVDRFIDIAGQKGFTEIKSEYVDLQKGKKFYVGYFKKMGVFSIGS